MRRQDEFKYEHFLAKFIKPNYHISPPLSPVISRGESNTLSDIHRTLERPVLFAVVVCRIFWALLLSGGWLFFRYPKMLATVWKPSQSVRSIYNLKSNLILNRWVVMGGYPNFQNNRKKCDFNKRTIKVCISCSWRVLRPPQLVQHTWHSDLVYL